ncbi:hypothetical protein ACFQI7_09965 [Paenibacillus allorhizosphaerae]|uniref:Xylose isomerase-like TIM barrel domain-containing protein n=1 Tax=Paenibacillus allorhizosphaerae TaxID=2849866 RepID=A0ABM8VIW5_9BACL|nr:hypothetical protein [Paenibacillus allorhizosphaerae]CAG7644544.1 hypothetical protein PAECIP111802_03305 [Paenibacillus allorhizosphaerae]
MNLHYLPLTLHKQYLEDAALLAERYGGVRAFHLSHRLVHHADDVMNDSERLAQVQEIVGLLKNHRFQIWCWTHEIYDPPEDCVHDGRLDLDHPRLPPHLERKYEAFLSTLLTGLDGLVLTFAETQYEVYKNKNVDSLHSGSDAFMRKTRQLVDCMLETCKRMNARLAFGISCTGKKRLGTCCRPSAR